VVGVFALIAVPAVISELKDRFGSGRSALSSQEPAVSAPVIGSLDPTPDPSSGGTGAGPPPREAGPLGTVFRLRTLTSGGGTMTIRLIRVLDPARPRSDFDAPGRGKHLVGAVFAVRALSGTVDDDAYNDVTLVGSDGSSYDGSFDLIAGHTDFTDGAFLLKAGARTTGTISFEVPNGVRAAGVRWTAGSGFGRTVIWHLRPRR
jgi:hypothetical protein